MQDRIKSAITIIIFTFITIACVEYFLSWQKKTATSSEKMDEGFLLHDKQLGWKLQPNWQGKHSHKDFSVSYEINNQGFRKYQSAPSEVDRIAIIGDSFTFGIGVNKADTFANQLNLKMKDSNKSIQFTNYGVPGYSTDQEYLLTKNLVRQNNIKDTILVVYLGNDLIDNQYPYPIQANYAKPYFIADREQLKLKNYPVPLKQKGFPYSEKSLATEVLGNFEQSALTVLLGNFELGRRINVIIGSNKTGLEDHFENHLKQSEKLFISLLEATNKEISNQSGKLIVALLPSQAYVVSEKSIPAKYQSFLKQNIIEHYQNTDIEIIDLGLALREDYKKSKRDQYHPNEGHLNKQGHAVVANEIFKVLN